MKRFSVVIFLTILALSMIAGGTFAAQAAFKARMRANDIVPLPVNVDSKAKGQALFRLSSDGMTMEYELSVKRIDNVIVAHIHQYVGDGRNGPIMVFLYPSPESTGPGAPTGEVTGELVSGVFGPEDLRNGFAWDQVLELMRTGQAYVNVHTSDAPAGEINGHIH